MPYITAIFPQADQSITTHVKRYRTDLRAVLADRFGYQIGEVAFIANPMLPEAIDLSENLLPLEFCVDVGMRPPSGLTDTDSDTLMEDILQRCPDLRRVHFGIWVRQLSSNGFSEHRPQ